MMSTYSNPARRYSRRFARFWPKNPKPSRKRKIVINARTTIATSALLPKNALIADSVVSRWRRAAAFSDKIDSRAIGRHFQRKNDANGRSPSKLALSLGPAAVQLGNVLHNRQPKTGAAEFATARFVRAIKPLEDAGQIFLTNSDTIIAYAKRDLIAGAVRFETNFTASTRIFNGVIEQIIKNLPQARFVRADHRNVLGHIDNCLQMLRGQLFFPIAHKTAKELREIDRT